MPYRAEPPLRTYRVKSSNTGVILAAVVGALAFGYLGISLSAGLVGVAVLVASFVTTLAIVSRVRYDRVAGGEGEVRLFRSHVEVPRAYAGEPLELPVEALRVHVQRFETRLYFVATVNAIEILHISAGSQKRHLSSRVFETPEDLQRCALDLHALAQGHPLPSHADPVRSPDARDAYDDQLDAELEALDD